MTASPANPFEHYLKTKGAEFTFTLGPGPRSPTLGDLDRTITEAQMNIFGTHAMAWVASRIVRAYEQRNVMPKNIRVTVSVKLDVDDLDAPAQSDRG